MKNENKPILDLNGILKGHAEVSEQMTISLSTLTLRKIENNNRYNIPEGARWSRIIKDGFNIGKRLNEAVKIVEEANPSLRGVFAHSAFEQIPDNVIFHMVHEINRLNISEDTSEISNSLLHLFASAEGRSGGEFITPKSVSTLLASLFKLPKGDIYDGASGITQLLIDVKRKSQEEVNLYGQEINHKTWALGQMSLILSGIDSATVVHGDTLRNPLLKDETGLKKFDYILMNPPFNLQNWGGEEAQNDLFGRFIYGVPSKSNGDMAFILHSLASLKENGRAAIIVTQGTLTRSGMDKKIRERLLQDDVIECIIGLPSKLFYNTSIPASIMVLNKNKCETRKDCVLFINAEDHYYKANRYQNKLKDEHIEEIKDTYQNWWEVEDFSKVILTHEVNNANLSVKSYFLKDEVSTNIGTAEVDLGTYQESNTPKVPLKELGNFFRGYNASVKTEPKEPSHKFIQLGDVQNGRLEIDTMTSIEVPKTKKIDDYQVQEGDLVISSRGATIKIAVIPKLDDEIILSQNFIGFRPNSYINPYFIKAFLESPVGMYYLTLLQKGTAVKVLNKKDLEDILIPSINKEEQERIATNLIQLEKDYHDSLKSAEQKRYKDYLKLYKEMNLNNSFKI